MQRRGALAASAHIWPLPDRRQTPVQLREPSSQVKKTQAVNWTPVSLLPLRSLMKIYSPGCSGCLEHSGKGPTKLTLLVFSLPSNLPAFPPVLLEAFRLLPWEMRLWAHLSPFLYSRPSSPKLAAPVCVWISARLLRAQLPEPGEGSCLHIRHSPCWPQTSPLPSLPIRHLLAQLEGEALTLIFLASLLILEKCR